MSATQFPIIYSKATGRIRRYHLLDSDAELQRITPMEGEAVAVFPMDKFGNHLVLQELLSAQTGLVPKDDRFAIVGVDGKVQGVIRADLTCGDAIPGCELIAHDQADTGWMVTTDAQQKPIFTKPLTKPGIDKYGRVTG